MLLVLILDIYMYCVFDKFIEVGMIIYINVFIMLIFYESFKIKIV